MAQETLTTDFTNNILYRLAGHFTTTENDSQASGVSAYSIASNEDDEALELTNGGAGTRFAGIFSTTEQDTQDFSSYDGVSSGLSADKNFNSLYTGQINQTLIHFAGQFSTTQIDSENIGGAVSFTGISTDKYGDTLATDRAQDEVQRYVGRITSTEADSESTIAYEGALRGLSHDGAGDTPWCGPGSNTLYCFEGRFTSTMHTSLSMAALGTSTVVGIENLPFVDRMGPQSLDISVSDSVSVGETAAVEVKSALIEINVADSITVAETAGIAFATDNLLNVDVADSIVVTEGIKGSERVVNGDFATGDFTDWDVADAGWAVNGSDQAVGTSIDNDVIKYLSQSIPSIVGDGSLYQFQYEVIFSDLSQGIFLDSASAFNGFFIPDTAGWHTLYIKATNSSPTYELILGLGKFNTIDTSIIIDNISLKKVSAPVKINPLNADVLDSVAVAETVEVDRKALYHINVSDSISIAELAVADGLSLAVNVSDSISVAETVSVAISLNINVSDSIGVVDSVVTKLTGLNASVTDSISVAETVDWTKHGGFYHVSVSDQIGVSETIYEYVWKDLQFYAHHSGTLLITLVFTGNISIEVEGVGQGNFTSGVEKSVDVLEDDLIHFESTLPWTALTQFNIDNAHLIGDISVFAPCTNLTLLHMHNSHMYGNLSGLSPLVNLVDLNFGGCEITADTNCLNTQTLMTNLDVSKCRLTPTEMENLMASLVINEAAGEPARDCAVIAD